MAHEECVGEMEMGLQDQIREIWRKEPQKFEQARLAWIKAANVMPLGHDRANDTNSLEYTSLQTGTRGSFREDNFFQLTEPQEFLQFAAGYLGIGVKDKTAEYHAGVKSKEPPK
ncbi:hypothetical protein HY638_03325 [Candidatus Woesearchaeota archaeon]|nr:hypothetical protein [Candidatus Woesearchaeota archaeon]